MSLPPGALCYYTIFPNCVIQYNIYLLLSTEKLIFHKVFYLLCPHMMLISQTIVST